MEKKLARIREIESRLEALSKERSELISELTNLRSARPGSEDLPVLLGIPAAARAPESSDAKVDLFLKLFAARTSVFPRLWENRSKGTKGYSPACSNEWVRGYTCTLIKISKVISPALPKPSFPNKTYVKS